MSPRRAPARVGAASRQSTFHLRPAGRSFCIEISWWRRPVSLSDLFHCLPHLDGAARFRSAQENTRKLFIRCDDIMISRCSFFWLPVLLLGNERMSSSSLHGRVSQLTSKNRCRPSLLMQRGIGFTLPATAASPVCTRFAASRGDTCIVIPLTVDERRAHPLLPAAGSSLAAAPSVA